MMRERPARWVCSDKRRVGWQARVLSAVFLLAAVCHGSATARATDPTDEELIKQGVACRKRGDDTGALTFFQKAYQLRASPRAAAQIGLAEFALGRWVDAETHLGEAVAASADPWVRKNGVTLQDTLARVGQRLGDLDVMGQPAGAEIVIEGDVRGTLPLSKAIRVRSGECRFDVRASGYASVSRTVEIAAGRLTRETVKLSPLVAAPPPVAGNLAPAGVAAAQVPPAGAAATGVEANPTSPASGPEGRAPTSEGHGGSRLRTAGIVLGAVGVAAVGVGLFFGAKAKSAGDSDSQATVFNPGNQSTGRTYQTLQWVGYGVGAALIAGGVTTFLLGTSKRSDATDHPVALVGLPGGGGMALAGGRF
jgi:hypothetical protein